MLKLSASLMNQRVVSLRTGDPIAIATHPVINPHNLKILGWWCKTRSNPHPLVLLSEDVRQGATKGLTIDDEDDLNPPEDLVRHQEVLEARFELMNKPVKTKRSRLGKVEDYSYNEGMYVQKLYVARPITKVFASDHILIIDRTQILEVTDRYILVRDTEVKAEATEMAPAAEALPAA